MKKIIVACGVVNEVNTVFQKDHKLVLGDAGPGKGMGF
jgi:hypothetical protein